MPAASRTFSISTGTYSIEVVLHEPSLTADNLGMKTWASSYLLAKRLSCIITLGRPRVLELGAGTGLVGIAAASIWGATVYLTDLPEIVPNLTRNVEVNEDIIRRDGGSATTGVLDWSISDDQEPSESQRYPIILAADPLYSSEHPKLLVQTIERWLRRSAEARVVIELPLRDAYKAEIAELKDRMLDIELQLQDSGEDVGYDDWQSKEGGLQEVRCWWSIWVWKSS